jgi:hypothetical protein
MTGREWSRWGFGPPCKCGHPGGAYHGRTVGLGKATRVLDTHCAGCGCREYRPDVEAGVASGQIVTAVEADSSGGAA